MSAMTKEELQELAELEKEDRERREAAEHAAKRVHLDALRLAKRLSGKHGTAGRDFLILETKLGPIAIRRPVEVEVDSIEGDMDRGQLEKFAAAIVLEPPAPELQRLMAENPGLAGPLVRSSLSMLKVVREEESKK